MKHSDTINELATALSKAQGEMAGAVKDSANPFFKSKYADLASVWEACRKALTKNGLAVVQSAGAEGATVTVTTLLAHTSGQWLSSSLSMTAQKDDPQGIGSCITYARRYALASMVGVAPEDDDGNAASAKPNGQAVQETVPEPKGYANWLLDLKSVADEGLDPLKSAWTKSKPELRNYLTKTDPMLWEGLKARAAQRQEVSA